MQVTGEGGRDCPWDAVVERLLKQLSVFTSTEEPPKASILPWTNGTVLKSIRTGRQVANSITVLCAMLLP